MLQARRRRERRQARRRRALRVPARLRPLPAAGAPRPRGRAAASVLQLPSRRGRVPSIRARSSCRGLDAAARQLHAQDPGRARQARARRPDEVAEAVGDQLAPALAGTADRLQDVGVRADDRGRAGCSAPRGRTRAGARSRSSSARRPSGTSRRRRRERRAAARTPAAIAGGEANDVPGRPGPAANDVGPMSEKPTKPTRRPRRLTTLRPARGAQRSRPRRPARAPLSRTARTVSSSAVVP